MRKVFALGAAVLLAGSISVALAQERLPQHSGFGTGVGENAGTGTRSQVWDINVLRGNEKLAGFGGLGQRPDPNTERGIVTNSFSAAGGYVGQVMPGEVEKALGFTSDIGEVTGAAPCWNCDPQPGWGYS